MRGADTRRAWCDDLPADRRRADRDRLLLPEDESWRRGSMLELGQEPNGSLDDILYLGASADEVEQLFPKLASRGRLCVARQGARFHRRVSVPIGRIHYSGLRLTGTAGPPAAELITAIPSSGEIRAGSRVNIVGAGGPMGVMHVVRALCRGIPGITVFAGDLDDARLASLRRLAEPIAGRNGVALHTYHAVSSPAKGPFDYIVIMVPVPALVAQAVEQAAPRAIINLFAGLPVDVTVELDLNAYLDKQLHLIGTSGSTTEDMRTVLHRLESGSLDTDLSVAAVGGLEAALEGIHAVERRQIPGRIVLYPVCRGLQLTRLEEMPETLPHVAALLCDGAWNQHAEEALLRGYEASTGKR